MLTKDEQRTSQPLPTTELATEKEELRAKARRHVKRVRRLKINVAAWVLGTLLLTTLWVLNQWQANGAFERFGNEGNPGDWSPTLWALGVGIWGLIVGIMALRAHFERPPTVAEIEHECERFSGATADAELWRVTRVRLERIGRLKFHVAAWVLGMIVLTPLWALIEWQDNGGFERWSDNSRPGDWEPWILYVGGVWALVIALFALWVYVGRPAREARSSARFSG
jgi:sterol desaturase/sphingolipid hydroxylase (fatty acid hydroxylase superfamily)